MNAGGRGACGGGCRLEGHAGLEGLTRRAVRDGCQASRALRQLLLKGGKSPTPCNGALQIDSPPLAPVEELAPHSVVIGEDVPGT